MDKLEDEMQCCVVRMEDVNETEGTCVSKGVVRPVILVGADPWATTKVQEASLE